MSEGQDKRAERMARYKEERRKQLAAQFNNNHNDKRKDSHSSSSEGPRTTRASRLRAAAAAAQENQGTSSLNQTNNKIESSERSTPLSITGCDNTKIESNNHRVERDKSSKRKSNLNRALNSEEIPNSEYNDDIKSQRRRRRFFPPEIFEQSSKELNSNNEKLKSDINLTASNLSQSSTSPITASTATTISSTTPSRNSRKSELSIHMENARRGITPSYSEMGKYKTPTKRTIASPKEKVSSSSNKFNSDYDNDSNSKLLNGYGNKSNKENIKRKSNNLELKFQSNRIKSSSDNEVIKSNNNKNVSKKMEELTALTKETLARVERLANKNKENQRRPLSVSPIKKLSMSDNKNNNKLNRKITTTQPFSILKKSINDETMPIETITQLSNVTTTTTPVSILKRKVSSQDEHYHHHRNDGVSSSTHTPPVTFSPNVIEPTTTNRKQGILKKRRSLDESQVMRHRSCSPTDIVVNEINDSRSILKNQRRSSLEELTRTQSPELHLQSILKRKTIKTDDDNDHSLNSPQSILKRRSGASSAGSTNNTPHVSITTAVILAAARGAEMVLESESEIVKPILKKKSFSDDSSYNDSLHIEQPKPILKKKSSTDTDDCDDRPKKPILKQSRNSLDRDNNDLYMNDNKYFKQYNDNNSNNNDCDFKPILRQNQELIKPRLSFSKNDDKNDIINLRKSSRRSHTICTEFNVKSLNIDSKEEDRHLCKPRPISVSELVMSFENATTTTTTSTGAIPKKASFNRNSDRYKTQPVTFNELEASRNLVRSPQLDNNSKLLRSSPIINILNSNHSVHSLLDFTSSLENDINLNSFLSSSHQTVSSDSGLCAKMSSDSAFQSLGDGLEFDQDDDKSNDISLKTQTNKLEPKKLELQMKAIALEAQKMRLNKGSVGVQKYRNRTGTAGSSERTNSNRFSTQPVTFNEVQEASRINKDVDDTKEQEDNDPCNLTLSDRIKLFNLKKIEDKPLRRDMPKRRITRFQTQPITSNEVETARCKSPTTRYAALDGKSEKSSHERRGILKSNSTVSRIGRNLPKSVLKKRDSYDSSPEKSSACSSSILKTEITDITYDEGISCNDSGSDTEINGTPLPPPPPTISIYEANTERKLPRKSSSFKSTSKSNSDATTSDGDSSGGQEVRRIFQNENKLRVKQALESVLSKSKSQGTVGDEPSTNSSKSNQELRKNITIRRSQTQSAMPRTIAELQAKLQQRGESEWKKRIQQNNNSNDELKFLKDKNKYNDELTEKSVLALKKDELDASSRQWKLRVEKSDAEKFSVAGRMDKGKDGLALSINIPGDKVKKTPQPKRFKGKEGNDSFSTPVSPEKNNHYDLSRSFSVPETEHNSTGTDTSLQISSCTTVSVSRPDDYTFKNFYKNLDNTINNDDKLDISLDDFDLIERQSLLVQKKNIQIPKRRGTTKNPLRALKARTDITNEYTQVLTGVAEREMKRLNIEKLAKHSNFAIEALAGLASKEDFKSVALKKSSFPSQLLPYNDLMLLQVKGRRHVQTRLVEPKITSLNEGDNFILITPNALYNYIGIYSNIIEQSRAADIVNHIQQTGDMGCKVDNVITINMNDTTLLKNKKKFYEILGSNLDDELIEIAKAGHPNEDEIYESNIITTNMIYNLENDELVPLDNYWGTIPKIEILLPTNVLVFDFGSEMYVWSGKNASLERKRRALKLAKELWDEGYNYTNCNICPLNVAEVLGERNNNDTNKEIHLNKINNKRPDWAIFSKITQHRETILFKEKFLDWPDFSRVIKIKNDNENDKFIDPTYDIQPCNVKEMLKLNDNKPDIIIEGSHLGRGDKYFDEETKRLFEFNKLDISVWRILENTSEKLSDKCIGHFYDCDSYILRWRFRMTVKGRELSGKPSKFSQTGRDRCVYFCWQGLNASINEKGYAALLTIELDNEKAPQIRVVQGTEPAAFLKLFNGNMVIHCGKRDDHQNQDNDEAKLFIVNGEIEDEVFLSQVQCNIEQLRSRTAFILIDSSSEKMFIWYGAKISDQKRKITKQIVERIVDNKAIEFCLDDADDIEIEELEEGDESSEFFDLVGKERDSYVSLIDSKLNYDYTPRLFHLSSISGAFEATEILSPYRSEYSSPYPFLQSELYSASQPAIFLLDNHHELWLWQGWWPEIEETVELSDQTGSGAVRWQAERKAAMQTAVKYWHNSHDGDESVNAYLVWAGLEPLEFKNLFPSWIDREDVTKLNLKEDKKMGSKLLVENELALLMRTTYPLSDLLTRPLPEGVDPTHLEIYLSPEDFQDLLSLTKEEFQKLPPWKQTALKKEKGLF